MRYIVSLFVAFCFMFTVNMSGATKDSVGLSKLTTGPKSAQVVTKAESAKKMQVSPKEYKHHKKLHNAYKKHKAHCDSPNCKKCEKLKSEHKSNTKALKETHKIDTTIKK